MLNKKISLLAGSAALMLGNVCAISHAADNAMSQPTANTSNVLQLGNAPTSTAQANNSTASAAQMQAVAPKMQPRNFTINVASPQANQAQASATTAKAAPASTAVAMEPQAHRAIKAGEVMPFVPDNAQPKPANQGALLTSQNVQQPRQVMPQQASLTASASAQASTKATATSSNTAQASSKSPTVVPANTTSPAKATDANVPANTATAGAANIQPVASRGTPAVTEELNIQTKGEIKNRAQVNDQLYPASNNTAGRGDFTPAEPGFTFENQEAEQKAADGGTGNPNDQIQEVSVTMLTDFDAAVVEGFKSLESSLTLGMGKSTKLTIDDVAPALRSFTSDADGNLVLRFSVPMAESIIKKMGSSSWSGLSNPILVWMAGLDGTNNGTNMALVSGQNLSPFASAILAAAPEYKYRMIFPVLDIEEIRKVNVNTVLNHQDEILAEATARYGSDYFIAAAISSVPNESGMTFKWDLYNKDGEAIAQSSISGMMDEVAALGAGDIARALMTYQANQTEQDTPSALSKNNVDIDMVGPGDGYVRMRISNVRSLQDIKEIRNIFITYGFDGDTRIIGFDNGLLVFEVATNSNPENLAATMRRAGEFKYLAPWTFDFVKNISIRPSYESFVSESNAVRPNSKINPQLVKERHPMQMRSDSQIGIGEGLPNRNAPAIQGADL